MGKLTLREVAGPAPDGARYEAVNEAGKVEWRFTERDVAERYVAALEQQRRHDTARVLDLTGVVSAGGVTYRARVDVDGDVREVEVALPLAAVEALARKAAASQGGRATAGPLRARVRGRR
jgi:hypothetical protein